MATDKKRIRRNHSPALKAQILAPCAAPGASVAKIAMAHGINANIVHGWRKLARDGGQPALPVPAFVPVRIEPPATPVPTAAQRVEIELRRGPLSVRIDWPLSAAAEMSAWLRELLR
ncbi:transposase [Inhella sp.]|uniref:IS66-like element accessory protein TnpA n=1 Tax=Inhella sp. TaxID=1921806 RepID=UPI0035B32AC1